MREATNGRYPTFIVWENVPGAFTGHSGRDFRAVLEEITKTDIPMPASGKWANAGVVRSERIHAAWRVLDAQYWGVPQRRKRIYLVGSFGSNSAEEILFKCDSVQGYLETRREAGENIGADIGNGTAERDSAQISVIFDARGNGDGNTAPTITGDHNNRVTDYTGVVCCPAKANTLTARYDGSPQPDKGSGTNIVCVAYSAGFQGQNSITAGGVSYEAEKSPTLRAGVILVLFGGKM